MELSDNQSYYDAFSSTYDVERLDGYHTMIDELEFDFLRSFTGPTSTVLEAGCGTGLILQRIRPFVKQANGVDLSLGMLSKAKERGLDVSQADLVSLPFEDNHFDVVYSFKVLPHIADIEKALAEMVRVLKPGGYLLTEFYNPYSLRGLIKKIKSPTSISGVTHDEAILTRYDSVSGFKKYLPVNVRPIRTRGIRIITPFARLHKIPGLKTILGFLEKSLADVPWVRNLGGFLVLASQKKQ